LKIQAFDHRQHVKALIPFGLSDGSNALLVFTHSLKWVVCSLNQQKQALQIDLEGSLSASPAAFPDAACVPFPDKVHSIILSDASSQESCNSATVVVAISAWSGVISLFEIDVSSGKHELSTKVVHIPIPVDWDGGMSDATAQAVFEQATSEATSTSANSNAGLSSRLSGNNASNVDASLAVPQNNCQIIQLVVANRPSPLEEGIAIVVLRTEGFLAVNFADGGVSKSSPGPCHLQCTFYKGASLSLEDAFSVKNLHPSTLISILGFGAHGPLVLCVSDLDIFLINGSGFIFRQDRPQPSMESLVSLRQLRAASPTQYLLVSNRGTFEVLSFDNEPRADVTSPKVVCISDMQSAATKTQAISWVDILHESSTCCVLVVVDDDGQVSLANLNMYTPRHITMDFRNENSVHSQFLSPVIDIVPLSSVPSYPSLDTQCLFDNFKMENENMHVPVLSTKQCPPRLVVYRGGGISSLDVMEKVWPLHVTDLRSCEVGLGTGYRMHTISQSKSKSFLFFEQQEGLQSLMELNRTNDTIEAMALGIHETAFDHRYERTLSLHRIILPQLNDISGSMPMVVVLHSTHHCVRALSEDCSQVLTEWNPSSVFQNEQTLVAVSVPTLSACIQGDASMFLFTVAVSNSVGGCEICILGVGQENNTPSIHLVANFSTNRAVSSLTMYDIAQRKGFERQRRAIVAFSCWGTAESPWVTFIAAEGVPLTLPLCQTPTEIIPMALLFDSSIPLPASTFVPADRWLSSYEPPLISSMIFLALVPQSDSIDCGPECPSLVVGLTDGRLLVVTWSFETSGRTASLVAELQEITQIEIGRQPIKKLIPVDLEQHGESDAKARYCSFALIVHSSDADIIISYSSPREPHPNEMLPQLKECIQVHAIASVIDEETSEMCNNRRDLSAISSKSNDGNVADFDIDLVWQDDLGRISLGTLRVTRISERSKIADASGRNFYFQDTLQPPEYIYQKRQNTLTTKVAHLLYLPNLNALLMASADSISEKYSLSILDTSSSEVAFKELWQQDLAKDNYTTALSLAFAPECDVAGTTPTCDGTCIDAVAVSSILRAAASPTDPLTNYTQVAILQFQRPRGVDSAVAMECLGAVRISGTCFGLGLVQSHLGNNDGSAVVATVDTELAVLIWARKDIEGSKSTKWRLRVEDKVSSPNGGVLTSLSTLGCCVAVAEVQASVLVFRWSGTPSADEQPNGRLILVARCLTPVLSSSILLASVAPPAVSPESKTDHLVEFTVELSSLRVIVADARRAGVTCLRVAPLAHPNMATGARPLPPIAVAPEVSEAHPRQSHKEYLNATSGDSGVAELIVVEMTDAHTSEAVTLLRRADLGGNMGFFSLGCRGSIASFRL